METRRARDVRSCRVSCEWMRERSDRRVDDLTKTSDWNRPRSASESIAFRFIHHRSRNSHHVSERQPKKKPPRTDDSPDLARFPRRFSSRLSWRVRRRHRTPSRARRTRVPSSAASASTRPAESRKHRRALKRVRGPHAHARVAGVIAPPADTESVVVIPTGARRRFVQ